MRWLTQLYNRWFAPRADSRRRLHSYQHVLRLISSKSTDVLSGQMVDIIDSMQDLTWPTNIPTDREPVYIQPRFPNIDQCVLALNRAVENIAEDRAQVWDAGLNWIMREDWSFASDHGPFGRLRFDRFMVTETGHRIDYDVAVERLGDAMRQLIQALSRLSLEDPIRFRYHLLRVQDLLSFGEQILEAFLKSSEQHLESEVGV